MDIYFYTYIITMSQIFIYCERQNLLDIYGEATDGVIIASRCFVIFAQSHETIIGKSKT